MLFSPSPSNHPRPSHFFPQKQRPTFFAILITEWKSNDNIYMFLYILCHRDKNGKMVCERFFEKKISDGQKYGKRKKRDKRVVRALGLNETTKKRKSLLFLQVRSESSALTAFVFSSSRLFSFKYIFFFMIHSDFWHQTLSKKVKAQKTCETPKYRDGFYIFFLQNCDKKFLTVARGWLALCGKCEWIWALKWKVVILVRE